MQSIRPADTISVCTHNCVERMETASSERRELDDLFSVLYEELRRLAASARRNESRLDLSPTTLVHEAWLKLKDSPLLASKSNFHFKSIAAKAMRQVLVDEARRRHALKRGGDGEAVLVTLGDFGEMTVACDAELLDLDSALEKLKVLNARQAEIVESRFFGGQSIEETADILGISVSAVERDWRVAKAWLASRIRPGAE